MTALNDGVPRPVELTPDPSDSGKHSSLGLIDVPHSEDPYVLSPAKIQEPPKGWGPSLRFLGPGMITSAAVVGSGELITATTLGAQAGMTLLWLILVSTFVKVAVQIELARWSISTGKPALFGYDQVPPRLGKRSWASYIGLLIVIEHVTSQAGVVGGAALAASMLLPFGGDPFSMLSVGIWVAIFIFIAIVIHQINRYDLIESLSTALVVLVTALVVLMVFAIHGTEFGWTGADLADGMRFRIAGGAMGMALAMFGMTGVGAGEISGYTFWCVEKGYAAWTGPNDGSEAWVRRAKGWISVMKKDAWLSWVIYTISTAAFYILGASVLHKQGLQPAKSELIATISRIFTDTMGSWAGPMFLVFAAIALEKTILANVPTLCRQIGASLAVFGFYRWTDMAARDKVQRVLMLIMPVCWGLTATVVNSPLVLIVAAGVMNAIYLMVVAVATVYLSATDTDPRIKDGRWATVYLVVSALAIFGVGILSLFDI